MGPTLDEAAEAIRERLQREQPAGGETKTIIFEVGYGESGEIAINFWRKPRVEKIA